MLIGSVYSLVSTFNSWVSSTNILLNIIALIAYGIFISIILSVYDYFFGWAERKMIAKVQLRHGPTYVGKFGILQNLADVIKLLAKEHIVPDTADKFLYAIGLPAMMAISVLLVLVLPFSPYLQATNLALGLLFVLVLLSFIPLFLFVSAYSTGNKFADISAQRSVLMMLSYELPMIIVFASIALLSKGFNIAGIITAQSGTWFVWLMPIGFVVFFIAMLAELERPPFDFLDADSELIAGWLTDYSAPYYALALFLDYTRMLFGSLIIAILFFGGWSGPILPPIIWLLIKAVIISLFIIIVRTTLVRMRIDRMLRFGWIWMLPLSLVNLIITYMVFIH